MTIDEAIKHSEEVAKEKEGQAWEAQLQEEYGMIKSCKECAEEHRQLAEWLRDYKRLLEQEPKTEWIPVSEGLPEKNMACLVSVGELYLTQIAMYSDLMGTIDHKIFYMGDYGEENFEDITKYVKAWMPLPPSYQGK